MKLTAGVATGLGRPVIYGSWRRSSAENKHPALITQLYLLSIQAKYFLFTHTACLSLPPSLSSTSRVVSLSIILAVINRFWFKPPFHPRGRWRWNVAASSAHQCVTTRWRARSPGCCCFLAVLTAPSNILIRAFTLIVCSPLSLYVLILTKYTCTLHCMFIFLKMWEKIKVCIIWKFFCCFSKYISEVLIVWIRLWLNLPVIFYI